MVSAGLLLLGDSRVPAGGHVHSGGIEAAWRAGLVTDVASLRDFLVGRLTTTGRVCASFAACAARMTPDDDWALLDEEFDARTPSAAQRAASRQQGRGLMRAYPGAAPWLGPKPHQPIAFGVLSGASPEEVAVATALASVTAPASAALRLLALDPFAVHRMLVTLTSTVDSVAAEAARDGLADDCAPLLDVLAEAHHQSEGQLFVS
ncbi:urease accessory protein UreF [Allokutzneria sp. A3M-2-11 16]|uniref:urease accessory protein UreF n=1 Tax=Allokutzneria sp. A3M-2-11 16 TaxID=2962043 RepID=UPI0020B69274|nr:urease accessory UreF family protein [Allokutzneria sp. A3M-2-11 16]MCP3801517.1 urease accessory protein UreF [Allokutzneria sp. A3M-2-11 16]